MSATAGLGALFAKKKKKVKSLNMTAKMKEEAKVEETNEETTEEHSLEDNFTAIVSGAEPLVKTETKIVKTDLIVKEDEADATEQPEPVESSEAMKKGWSKTPAEVTAEVEEEEKKHEIEEAERLAAKKEEEAAKPKVYVPAYLQKMRDQKKAQEAKERIRDEGLTPAQMMELEKKKKLAQQEAEKKQAKKQAAAASAASEEKKRQEREEAQRRKAELKEQVKKAMAAEVSSKQSTPEVTASKADGSAPYEQLIAKYNCRERRPVRPHAELDPCFLPPLQKTA
ncbi:S-antigen protein precursor, putative [Perkinsus marinus ATCC 50983]|uniref:S-antigen protein, putative n=1 Tax=Perkinsus marinus (strain ATCC 50983 / TXsc) TaxID=423536 RepID=C5KK64_PERM5|nr:S-antigen protein precursor, putative [Perkinsus marinus ATCC 50983]EER14976.1 S-antigen protein precursor, putative [Perkinsus marinus ATCC 50983]|eukprot:XP_002783180.1 S-antigen protein precursor, putative [Perkinsus marinus ATCC 50983]